MRESPPVPDFSSFPISHIAALMRRGCPGACQPESRHGRSVRWPVSHARRHPGRETNRKKCTILHKIRWPIFAPLRPSVVTDLPASAQICTTNHHRHAKLALFRKTASPDAPPQPQSGGSARRNWLCFAKRQPRRTPHPQSGATARRNWLCFAKPPAQTYPAAATRRTDRRNWLCFAKPSPARTIYPATLPRWRNIRG